jgi:hypothetical protein
LRELTDNHSRFGDQRHWQSLTRFKILRATALGR